MVFILKKKNSGITSGIEDEKHVVNYIVRGSLDISNKPSRALKFEIIYQGNSFMIYSKKLNKYIDSTLKFSDEPILFYNENEDQQIIFCKSYYPFLFLTICNVPLIEKIKRGKYKNYILDELDEDPYINCIDEIGKNPIMYLIEYDYDIESIIFYLKKCDPKYFKYRVEIEYDMYNSNELKTFSILNCIVHYKKLSCLNLFRELINHFNLFDFDLSYSLNYLIDYDEVLEFLLENYTDEQLELNKTKMIDPYPRRQKIYNKVRK